MRRAVILSLALAACSGSGGTADLGPPIVGITQEMLPMMFRAGDAMQQLLPMLFVPDVAAENEIVFVPNPAPNAPPNSYLLHFPLDADGNGTKETTIDGVIDVNGLVFTATLTMTVNGADVIVTGVLDFAVSPDGSLQMSGSGTIQDNESDTTIDFAIDPATPIVAKIATGEANAVANLCAYSLSGAVDVDSEGPEESYSARWSFAHNRRSVQVTDATYVDSEGVETAQPDSTFEVPCDNGSISDWVGTFDFDWYCIPQEDGDSEMIVTVIGSNRIRIQDDPDDDLIYEATAVPGNPHVVRGFFIADGYREDFLWKLSADGRTFTQHSAYAFLPPLSGGGLCGGVGIKR